MSFNLSIDVQKTTDTIVQFIKNSLHKTRFSKLVIGLSGGIDSAVSLSLAVRAAGENNIYPGIFPYGELNKKGTADARMLVNAFKIPLNNVSVIDIKQLADPFINIDSSMDNLRRGNIMARVRMILLYDLSKKNSALVLGTENKTENLLGYFTRFGDEASDLEPLGNLYKTQVLQLAPYLNVPEKIINKTPTAGMWLEQTDERELGFTYKDADKILYLWHDKKYTEEAIVNSGLNPEVVGKVIKRSLDNSFKHKLPYLPG